MSGSLANKNEGTQSFDIPAVLNLGIADYTSGAVEWLLRWVSLDEWDFRVPAITAGPNGRATLATFTPDSGYADYFAGMATIIARVDGVRCTRGLTFSGSARSHYYNAVAWGPAPPFPSPPTPLPVPGQVDIGWFNPIGSMKELFDEAVMLDFAGTSPVAVREGGIWCLNAAMLGWEAAKGVEWHLDFTPAVAGGKVATMFTTTAPRAYVWLSLGVLGEACIGTGRLTCSVEGKQSRQVLLFSVTAGSPIQVAWSSEKAP